MDVEKHPCSEQMYRGWRHYPCSKNATRQEDGKWWCGVHAPSAKAARRATANEKYRAARAAFGALTARAGMLSDRAGAPVQVSYSLDRPSPTHVTIAADALDALLNEAGR